MNPWWISERKDVLSMFFGLLTLLAYARYATGVQPDKGIGAGVQSPTLDNRIVGRASKIFYVASLVLFAAGLMSKPMLVTLPFVLLVLDWWPLGENFRSWVPSSAFMAVGRREMFFCSRSVMLLTYQKGRGGRIV